jgi:Regulator of chromosome condensation (RCC1) repeat
MRCLSGRPPRRRLTFAVCLAFLLLEGCSDSTAPSELPQPTKGLALGVGGRHGCRLTTDGRALCWGRADAGQLGIDLTPLRSTAVPVSSGTTRFTSIAAGGLHTCALTAEGQAWCWGENDVGQAGFPSEMNQACGEFIHGWQCVPSPHPIEMTLRFDALVAGGANTCGFARDGAIYCWGSNEGGHTPVPLPAEPKLKAIALGNAAHLCGLTPNATAYCWGSNSGGQLGLGTVGGTHDVPTPVNGGLKFKAIAVGGEHTCALATDGKPWCWGRDILPPGRRGSELLRHTGGHCEFAGVRGPHYRHLGRLRPHRGGERLLLGDQRVRRDGHHPRGAQHALRHAAADAGRPTLDCHCRLMGHLLWPG